MSEPHRIPNLTSETGVAALHAAPHSFSPAIGLDGSSAAITQLRGQIRRVAPYFRTALLVGEPGCGEQAAAQILHQLSPLGQRAFVDVASADAVSLLTDSQSEAALSSIGMFYISQPERLSHSIQSALLRLLRRYGPQAPRVVACAERSLRPLVSASGFSADLAEHLGALRIALPPLRDRREDIPQLLAHLVQNIATLSGVRLPELAPDLLDAARLLPWRGNLTELASAADKLMERATRLILHASDLEAVLGTISQTAQSPRQDIRMIRLDDVIQEHIRAVLFACNGNKLRAAEVLGISRSTLYRMLDIPTQPRSQPFASSNLRMTV